MGSNHTLTYIFSGSQDPEPPGSTPCVGGFFCISCMFTVVFLCLVVGTNQGD